MKLCKYYSLDECGNVDVVMDHLDKLSDDGKIEYSEIDQDIIKIKDTGLNTKSMKELVAFLNEHDVIDYPDYENLYGEDEDEDEEESDEEDY